MPGGVRKKGKYRDGRRTKWQARYRDPTNPKHEITRTFDNKEDADAWLTQQGASVYAGTHIDPRRAERPFRELAEAWRETWINLDPKTQVGYESILNRWLTGDEDPLNPERPCRFRNIKTAAITPELVQKFVNELAAVRAPATVKSVYSVLRSALQVGVERRYIATNPCDAVKLTTRRHREQLFLEPAEVTTLAEAIDPHWRTLVYTAAYTGLRAGELGGLRRRDVDLLRGRLEVRQSLKDIKGKLAFGPPKTAQSRRNVSLPAPIKTLLGEHLAQPAPGGTGPDDLVFTTPAGTPIRQSLFYRRQYKPAVRAALPAAKHGLRFHDLRHTCASLSLAVSPNMVAVKERLGHSNITTTIDTYGHLLPNVDAALAEGLAGLYDDAAVPATNVRELRAAE